MGIQLAVILLKYFTIVLGLHLSIVLIIRFSGVLKITVCPDCGKKVSRLKRKSNDKTITRLSLGILPVKRYRCFICYWQGIGLPDKSIK